jgi:hypothetical protein
MTRTRIFLYIPGIAVVGIAAVSAFLPDYRLWGVNHLSFLPPVGRNMALAVIAVGMISPISRPLFQLLAKGVGWCKKHPSRVRVFLALGAVVGFALFLALSSSTLLLGDGRYLATTFRDLSGEDSVRVADHFRQVAVEEHVYPGAYALYFLTSRAAVRMGASDAVLGVKAVVALLGAFFLLIPLAFLCRSRLPFGGRLLIAGLVVTSGALELFFGYVEVYAPLILLAAAFCMSGFGVIFSRGSLWWPILFVVTGIIIHVQAFLLLPGMLFLLIYRRVGEGKVLNVASGVLFAAVIAGSLTIGQVGGLQRFVLPIWGSESSSGILSPQHIVDVINELMLIVPALPLVVGILFTQWKDAGDSSQARWQALRGAMQSPDVLFATMLSIPIGLFLWVFRPALGMARDWDLFANCGVMVVSVAYVVARRVTRQRWDELMKFAMPSVLVASVVLTFAWVVVNASERLSVARYRSILRYDTTNAGYAHENLSLHFHDKGDVAGEIHALERAVEFSPNPRYWFKLGLRYYSIGDKEKGVAALRKSLRSRPGYDRARQFLVQMLYFSQDYQGMVSACLEGERLAGHNPYYPFCAGQGYAGLGRWPEAREAFERCLELGPSSELIDAIQEILREAGPTDE